LQKRATLTVHVLGKTENMRIVLCERMRTHQSMQSPRAFVAMTRAELAEAQRQISVRANLLTKHLNVTWAVHWLECKRTLAIRECEHVVAVLCPVAAAFPQRTGE
jgi:hypothetical protein